jgi:hypothetical protein
MRTFQIIHKLGGVGPVFERLQALGLIKTRDALRMWRSRGAIPGDAQVALMRLAEEAGVAYTADDFILPTAEAAA